MFVSMVDGVSTPCWESKHDLTLTWISPEWMVKFHTGYELDANDCHDIELLCTPFGIAIPPEYERLIKTTNHCQADPFNEWRPTPHKPGSLGRVSSNKHPSMRRGFLLSRPLSPRLFPDTLLPAPWVPRHPCTPDDGAARMSFLQELELVEFARVLRHGTFSAGGRITSLIVRFAPIPRCEYNRKRRPGTTQVSLRKAVRAGCAPNRTLTVMKPRRRNTGGE